MILPKCCCCSKSVDKTQTISSNDMSSAGVHNKTFETWEPFEQRKSSAVTVEQQPKLSKASRISMESIKLSKIDFKLDIFGSNRFNDMSETIHNSVTKDLDKV